MSEQIDEQPVEPVTMDCAEPGCDKVVTFQPQNLPGLVYPQPRGPITVYLECPRGHVHPYQLTE
jgi:hypothetical protein